MLPFGHDAFIDVFRAYNTAIWPAQIAAYALGATVLLLLFRPTRLGGKAIAAILGLMWLWTGLAYHAAFFSTINRAAYGFAALFVVQGLMLEWAAVTGRLDIRVRGGVRGGIGPSMIVYAMLLYPAIGAMAGQSYPGVPVFGVAPSPLVIFTFGVLLMAEPFPLWLLIVPLLWSLIGGSAAFLLRIPQDWALLLSGVLAAVVFIVVRRHHNKPPLRP
ncbi:MAG TPA: DUF6064 family protein [Amaricoccus sp.]|uniref:DUF6064 family protein n=1 Tax=Amaricoccus sp. TaxID=1872485 RepID=UPI002BB519DF|nr:DUF6064 family protein [Amaricoccus sp.]HMQ95339.1 DUF6064 family protein [Amaricoccus sp.]HMR54861.1 DUF6064 family protein [Amaricoccus sp.]HMR62169.1 DUF6064 family protein [Amaricoccus sp.]HMU01902.1 DUF6064 family protein [Amaricoccus sp.]